MTLKTILTLGLCTFLTGCSSMQLDDFKNTTPEFVPQSYFNGPLKAYGMVKDRNGKILRTFKGDLVGSWDADLPYDRDPRASFEWGREISSRHAVVVGGGSL